MSERIYTKCPACDHDTLTINTDKHLLCTWIECPDPTRIDRLAEWLEEIAKNLVTDRDNWQRACEQCTESHEVTDAALAASQAAVLEMAEGQSALITLLERVMRAEEQARTGLKIESWEPLLNDIRATLNKVTIVEDNPTGKGVVVTMAPAASNGSVE